MGFVYESATKDPLSDMCVQVSLSSAQLVEI